MVARVVPFAYLVKQEDPKAIRDHEERLALNEALFREINERLDSRIRVFSDQGEQLEIICECADRACTERISLTPTEYANVRADPQQFVVVPGHEHLDVEEVISRTDEYEIVRKIGIAGEIAELLDPTDPRTKPDPPRLGLGGWQNA